MILNNYYHILGLDITAFSKEIEKRGKYIEKLLMIGEAPEFESDLWFIKEYRKKADIKTIIHRLLTPKYKIQHFFFWFVRIDDVSKRFYEELKQQNFATAENILREDGSYNSLKNLLIFYLLLLFLKEGNLNELVSKVIETIKRIQIAPFKNFFKQQYKLYDDLGTSEEIINSFLNNYLQIIGDLLFEISQIRSNNLPINIFMEKFNIKPQKLEEEVEKIYSELSRIAERLENMEISEDGVFDAQERKELEEVLDKIERYIDILKQKGLIEDSEYIVVLDKIAKALRSVALDLVNNLEGEEGWGLKLLEVASTYAQNSYLKDKIRGEQKIIKENMEVGPAIKNYTKYLERGNIRKAKQELAHLLKVVNNREDQGALIAAFAEAVFPQIAEAVKSRNFGKVKRLYYELFDLVYEYFPNVTQKLSDISLVPGLPSDAIVRIITAYAKNNFSIEVERQIFSWLALANLMRDIADIKRNNLIIWGQRILYGIIAFFVFVGIYNLFYESSSDYSYSYNYNSSFNNGGSKNTTNIGNDDKKDEVCYYKGKAYILPKHAHCVYNDPYNAWKCDEGYYEKGNNCWCRSGEYLCMGEWLNEKLKSLKEKSNYDIVARTKYNELLNDECECVIQ